SYASTDEFIDLLKTAEELTGPEKYALLKGITAGWNPKRQEKTSQKNNDFLVSIQHKLPSELASRYENILKSFGLEEALQTDAETQVIRIKAIREEMKYDLKEFTVKAGKPVEIVFENHAGRQNNILVGKPGALEILDNVAELMITKQDAAEVHYMPNVPEIIAASALVQPGESYGLTFSSR